MNKTGIAVAIVILMAGIALTAHLSTTTLEFSRHNYQWTGTSGFFALLEEADAREVHDLADLTGSSQSLLLLIAPDTTFSPEDITALRGFLEGGNTLFIADETGTGNSLLQGFGSSITIQPGYLCSVDMEFRDPHLVIATATGSDAILEGVSGIATNRPAVLEGGDMLLSSSFFSWMDVNGNNRIDTNESFSRYGILAREPVGNGMLYVLSDPSILINGMLDATPARDNTRFIENLLSVYPDILVDQTHSATGRVDGVLVFMNFVRSTMILKISALIVSLLLIMAVYSRRKGKGI
jgi:hypothetical protein